MRPESTAREIVYPEIPPLEQPPARIAPRGASEAGAITTLDRSALELLVRRPRRHILVVEDATFSGRALSRILGRWSFDVATTRGEDAARAVEGLDRVDLAIVSLCSVGEGAVALLDALRALPALRHTPVLAVVIREFGVVDCGDLRKRGVVGVMNHDTSAEHVAFRVGQIMPLGSLEERRHVRVPVGFAVEIDVDGEQSSQRAENLSMGGIRLRSTLALETNTLVGLRFRLPLHPDEWVSVEGRVIHCQPVADGGGGYTVGLFFRSVNARGRTLLEIEIVRLLTGSVPF